MEEIHLAGQLLFNIGSFPVTNTILTSWIITVLIMIAGVGVGINYKKLPEGIQHFWEMIYEYLEELAVSVAGETGRKFVPLAVTLFVYILINNWFELIPGVGSVGMHVQDHGQEVFVPFLRSSTSDINTTLALAIFSVLGTQVFGVQASGLLGHLKHFTNPMEIVSELSKLVSFSFRLFGNIFAGEVLLATGATLLVLLAGNVKTWYGAVGGLIQVPFFGLEILVGFIQAFIFAVLTLVFAGVYTSHSEEKQHA